MLKPFWLKLLALRAGRQHCIPAAEGDFVFDCIPCMCRKARVGSSCKVEQHQPSLRVLEGPCGQHLWAGRRQVAFDNESFGRTSKRASG
eukprot:2314497-Amphidinium_carterae.3